MCKLFRRVQYWLLLFVVYVLKPSHIAEKLCLNKIIKLEIRGKKEISLKDENHMCSEG